MSILCISFVIGAFVLGMLIGLAMGLDAEHGERP